MTTVCYLNGEFMPLDEARVPVLDRGFIFGDGVYEVIPVFGGRPFRLKPHLSRLARSLEATGIRDPLNPGAWSRLVATLIERNPFPDLSVYVQVTRGVAPRNHAAPKDCQPTLFAMVSPMPAHPEIQPVAVASMADIRWLRCDIKAIALLPNVLARTAAVAAGAYEAVMFRDDQLTEGASSNVFAVIEGTIRTPPHSGHILPGITRDSLVEALAGTGDAVRETTITRAELMAADEIWLTSSTRDLVPVATLDGLPVGQGAPGPVYRRVMQRYEAFKQNELAASA